MITRFIDAGNSRFSQSWNDSIVYRKYREMFRLTEIRDSQADRFSAGSTQPTKIVMRLRLQVVTVWANTPLDWESWVLELSSGNAIDVAFQPKSGVLASLAEDG